MLPAPSTTSRARPQLANLLILARNSLGKAVNGEGSESREMRSLNLSKVASSPSSAASSASSIGTLLPSSKTAAFVASCLLWYFASALSSNTSKALLSSPKHLEPRPSPPFPYPVTLTLIQFVFIHLLSSAVASPSIMAHVPGFRKPVTRIVANPGWQRIGDMAKLSVFNVVGHALSTVAISRVPVSTVHTIKALTPLFTVLSFRYFFNVRYSFMAYFSLVPLTLGVMMACTSLSFSANDLVGLTTALASTFIFVAQSIYSKNLVGRGSEEKKKAGLTASTKDPNGKLDKINILYYTSACSILIMIPMALYYDGAKLLRRTSPISTSSLLPPAPHATSTYIAYMITANGLVQFAQNFLAFSVLALVSPVTYSIASLFKRVFVICFAIIWFGQSVSVLQWCGIVLTFVGLYIYNDAKASKSIAKGEEAMEREERRKSFTLPTTARGAAWLNGDVLRDTDVPKSATTSSAATQTAYQASFPVIGTSSFHDGKTSRSTSQKRPIGDVGVSIPLTTTSTATTTNVFPSVLAPSNASSIAAIPPVSPANAVYRNAGSSVSIGAAPPPIAFPVDPRRSIPSPPPSRGPSSDDEGDDKRQHT